MIDPGIVHELIFGGIKWPENMRSDVAKISYFARENDVSLEDLANGLDKFIQIYRPEESTYANLWLQVAEKTIRAQRMLVKNNLPGLLDTKLTGTGDDEYGTRVYKSTRFERKYIVQILQKRRDDEMGERTGVPNAEYWDGTPGQYYASTLLGWDEYGRGTGNVICIDGRSNWNVYGMNALRDEIKQKYGDEIK